jgi:2-amino-4-hydroxy-6-hydroxymethyldihydropteridine diphosphokinase
MIGVGAEPMNVHGALVFIGVGSNLDDPKEQVRRGIRAVAELRGCRSLACSSLYTSPPMGPRDQPDYVNAVVAIDCALPPAELLRELQAIEIRHGRIRSGVRWAARTLDLDVLLYNQNVIKTDDLIIPHAGIADRAFVLYPLAEIAPRLFIPGKGSIADLLKNCSIDGLTRIG